MKQQSKPVSVRRQCILLSLTRSSLYYQKQPESPLNLTLMNRIDALYTEMPFCGVRKITKLLRDEGYAVNHKRVSRLMGKMGLEAQYPKPKTSQANPQNPVYPYLLKGVEIEQPNQVWSTDITYIPMPEGFCYLVAIMDWYSRQVLSWRISTTLETGFCVEALEEAIAKYGVPQVFNTDQGSQFTALAWISALQRQGIRISMDGRGRYLDNIFTERLWRSVKHEDVYLKRYETVAELKAGLSQYFDLYNQRRPHQGLDYQTPAQVYQAGVEKPFKSLAGLTPLPTTFEQLSNDYDECQIKEDRLRA